MSWETEQRILELVREVHKKQEQTLVFLESINVKGIQLALTKLQTGQTLLISDVTVLVTNVNSLIARQATIVSALSSVVSNQQLMETQISQILKILIPPPAVTCIGTITLDQPIGENMAKKAATIASDLQVADNGTFTGTLTFKDADGVTTTVPAGLSTTFTSSDATPGPSIFNLTNPGPSGDGSTFAGTVNQTTVQALVAAGTPLPSGLIISFTATWTGLSTPISETFTPNLDVVAGPAATAVAVVSEP